MRGGWLALRDLPFWVVTALVYVFLLWPFVVVAVLSLGTRDLMSFAIPPPELSVELYQNIPIKYFETFSVSFSVAAASAIISALIGGAAALGIVRSQIPGKEFLQNFFRLPLQIPFVVTGVVFLQFYNQVFRVIELDLLASIFGLVLAHGFVTIPYSVGAISAVLMRINPEIEEAAQSLGASNWSTFRRVTFPLMRPGIFAGMAYAFIISFGDVPVALFLAGGGFVTLPVEIFQDVQFNFEPVLFSVSTLVVIFSGVMIVAMQRFAGLDLVLPSSKR